MRSAAAVSDCALSCCVAMVLRYVGLFVPTLGYLLCQQMVNWSAVDAASEICASDSLLTTFRQLLKHWQRSSTDGKRRQAIRCSLTENRPFELRPKAMLQAASCSFCVSNLLIDQFLSVDSISVMPLLHKFLSPAVIIVVKCTSSPSTVFLTLSVQKA